MEVLLRFLYGTTAVMAVPRRLHGTCLRAGFILYSVPVRLCWAIICVVWTRLEKVMFASHLQILYTCILSITWLKLTNWRNQNHASSK